MAVDKDQCPDAGELKNRLAQIVAPCGGNGFAQTAARFGRRSRLVLVRRRHGSDVLLLCWLLLGVVEGANAQTVLPMPTGVNVGGTVYAMAVQADGSIVVGGTFSTVDNVPRNNIARLNPDGSVDLNWNPNADGDVMALVVSATTVYAGGQFAHIGSQARANLAALDESAGSAGLATGWNPQPDLPAFALAISADQTTVYAGGIFANIGVLSRNNIAAIDAGSGVATAWNPGADAYVRGLAVSGSIVYAIGEFTHIGTQARTGIARFGADGSVDAAWNPNPDGPTVAALAIANGAAFAGGNFLSIGGQPYRYLAAIDASSVSTGSVLTWDPDPHSDVKALAISGNTVYESGSFAVIGGQNRAQLAAVDGTSGLVTGWNPGVDGNDSINALAVSGNTVYVAGNFTTIAGQSRAGLAALTPSGTATVPSAPTIGIATAVGDTQATISFTPPTNTGCPSCVIIGYTVTCTPTGTSLTASGSASPITITNLTFLTTYACSVTATNVVGTSLPSASLNVTPGDLIFRNGFD